jgi:twitching motility protein PilT
MNVSPPYFSVPSVAHPVAQTLSSLLVEAVGSGCSDVHLRAQTQPWARRQGRMVALRGPALSANDIGEAIRLSAMRDIPPAAHAFEYSFDHGSAFRVRCHAYRDNGGWALAMRIVPSVVPGFAELRLPPAVKTLAAVRPGLVLITGAMGNGKSTSAAAILQHIASSEQVHIVTLEDPIEYRLTSTVACVSQREIGRDASTLKDGLREALREDADVLFVGEIRDAEELDVALHAADMGMSVFATFHTAGAVQTISRLIALHPADAQAAARERIAESLRGVLSQRLLPRKGISARVVATEVLLSTMTTKECIREPGRLKGLPTAIERAGDVGMHTFDQSLLALCSAGLVEHEVAAAFASSPGNLKRALSLSGMAA